MKSGRGTFNYLSGPEFTGPDRALGVAGSSGPVAAADEGEASAPGPAPRQGGGAGTAPAGVGGAGGQGRPPGGARVSDTLHTQPSPRCFLCVSSFIPIIPVLHGNQMSLL